MRNLWLRFRCWQLHVCFKHLRPMVEEWFYDGGSEWNCTECREEESAICGTRKDGFTAAQLALVEEIKKARNV